MLGRLIWNMETFSTEARCFSYFNSLIHFAIKRNFLESQAGPSTNAGIARVKALVFRARHLCPTYARVATRFLMVTIISLLDPSAT